MACVIWQNQNVRTYFESCSTLTHTLLFSFSFSLLFLGDLIFSFEYGSALGRIFTSISFGLIISAQAITKRKSNLNLQKLSFASNYGKFTYGIYLLHPISITFVDVMGRLLGSKNPNFLSLVSMGLVSIYFTMILSKLSYKYFEFKFLLLKETYTPKKHKETRELVHLNGDEVKIDPARRAFE